MRLVALDGGHNGPYVLTGDLDEVECESGSPGLAILDVEFLEDPLRGSLRQIAICEILHPAVENHIMIVVAIGVGVIEADIGV